jgi:hypothetical protein
LSTKENDHRIKSLTDENVFLKTEVEEVTRDWNAVVELAKTGEVISSGYLSTDGMQTFPLNT